MMEMQAVIGRIQLKRMPDWTAKRQANAAKLAQSRANPPASAWWRCPTRSSTRNTNSMLLQTQAV